MKGSELRAKMEGTRKRGRGRPRADSVTVAEVEHPRGNVALVLEVLTIAHAMGDRRGSLAHAERTVATKHRIRFETVHQRVKEHRVLRTVPADLAALKQREMDEAELVRRMRGFPPAVRRALAPLPAMEVLAILRAHRVNGACPRELVEWAEANQPESSDVAE